MRGYDSIGVGYAKYRQPDGRIARAIRAAIGDVGTLINVGAGAGSYEPDDLAVTAVEPSWKMLSQRVGRKAVAVRAVAERLPFNDATFDVALAVLTVHHWQDPEQGLREMIRVARQRVVVLTWDPRHAGFWLTRDYFPEILELDRPIFPDICALEAALGGTRAHKILIPGDCTDGFLGAYWKRPAAYLEPEVRGAISTFSRMADPAAGLAKLQSDLTDGTWLKKNGALASREELDLGYRLIVSSSASERPLAPRR
jgi:SAM-dependent methyltransferase